MSATSVLESGDLLVDASGAADPTRFKIEDFVGLIGEPLPGVLEGIKDFPGVLIGVKVTGKPNAAENPWGRDFGINGRVFRMLWTVCTGLLGVVEVEDL